MLRIDENGNVFINGKNVHEIAKEAQQGMKTGTRRRVVVNGKVVRDEIVESSNQDFPPQPVEEVSSSSINHTVVIRNGEVIQNDIVTNNDNFNEEEFEKEFFKNFGEFSSMGMDFNETLRKESDIIAGNSADETNESHVFQNSEKTTKLNENPKLIRCDFCGEYYKRRKKKCPHCGAKDGVI